MRLALRLSATGSIIFCYADITETYRKILDRLNKFRSPESQLTDLYDQNGLPLNLDESLHIREPTTYTMIT
jgi:hypothetical protein